MYVYLELANIWSLLEEHPTNYEYLYFLHLFSMKNNILKIRSTGYVLHISMRGAYSLLAQMHE